MPVLFVALRPPPAFRAALVPLMEGVDGARWQNDAQLHVTLRYIGPVEERDVADIAEAVLRLPARPVTFAARGVGVFEKQGRANTLWAGIAPAEPLADLHRKLDRALVALGLPPEGRAYRPHATVARIARSAAAPGKIAAWRARHHGFATPPVTLEHLTLFETVPGPGSAIYRTVVRAQLSEV